MKTLQIQEPWAWLMFRFAWGDPMGMENRAGSTKWRGWLQVYVPPEYDQAGADWVGKEFGIVCPVAEKLRLGGVVGMARLVDVVEGSESRWFWGPFGWVLEERYPMPFWEMERPAAERIESTRPWGDRI